MSSSAGSRVRNSGKRIASMTTPRSSGRTSTFEATAPANQAERSLGSEILPSCTFFPTSQRLQRLGRRSPAAPEAREGRVWESYVSDCPRATTRPCRGRTSRARVPDRAHGFVDVVGQGNRARTRVHEALAANFRNHPGERPSALEYLDRFPGLHPLEYPPKPVSKITNHRGFHRHHNVSLRNIESNTP